MLNAFLLWRREPVLDPDPHAVADALQALFAPLLSKPMLVVARQTAAVSMVYLHRPSRGWLPSSFEEGEASGGQWSVAPDYPLDVRAVLHRLEGREVGPTPLLALGRALRSGRDTVGQLAPPFSIAWSDGDETLVQVDGLGQAQLFEHSGARGWALSNRLLAFRALGLPLRPVPTEWAARWTLGWFPLDLTGYQSVRAVAPGARYRLSPAGLATSSVEVIGDWVTGAGLGRDGCLELAHASLRRQIEAVSPLWTDATLLFSGGWDSRAVAAALRASGSRFRAQVTGLPGNPDVVVAERLAEIAGLPLEIRAGRGLPPEDAAGCRDRIVKALLWESGHRLVRRHPLFPETLRPGRVRISGKHGEIGRGFYWQGWGFAVEASSAAPGRLDDAFVERLLHHLPRFTRWSLREGVRDLLFTAVRQADRFGLQGLSRLAFFYLFERNRRGQSGTHGAKTDVVFTPFLNPDYIRACFALPPREHTENPFHRHLIARDAPDWVGVPIAADLVETDDALVSLSPPLPSSDWRRPVEGRNYDNAAYWRTVGRPLIEACLAREGTWTEVFDPERARQQWESAPDALVVMGLLDEALYRGR